MAADKTAQNGAAIKEPNDRSLPDSTGSTGQQSAEENNFPNKLV
jgi:hypothetical protein